MGIEQEIKAAAKSPHPRAIGTEVCRIGTSIRCMHSYIFILP